MGSQDPRRLLMPGADVEDGTPTAVEDEQQATFHVEEGEDSQAVAQSPPQSARRNAFVAVAPPPSARSTTAVARPLTRSRRTVAPPTLRSTVADATSSASGICMEEHNCRALSKYAEQRDYGTQCEGGRPQTPYLHY